MYIVTKAPFADRAILVITFLLTVFVDLVVAVNVGVILAILQFLRRMSESVETQRVESKALEDELEERGLEKLPPGLLVYEIAGPMFFGAVEKFEHALLGTHTDPTTLIIRLRDVPFIDITGIQTLAEVIGKLHKRDVSVLLCEANDRVLGKLRVAGILQLLRGHGYGASFTDALRLAGVPAARVAGRLIASPAYRNTVDAGLVALAWHSRCRCRRQRRRSTREQPGKDRRRRRNGRG